MRREMQIRIGTVRLVAGERSLTVPMRDATADLWLSLLFCECGKLQPVTLLRLLLLQMLADSGYDPSVLNEARRQTAEDPERNFVEMDVLQLLLGFATRLRAGGRPDDARRIWDAALARWGSDPRYRTAFAWSAHNVIGEAFTA